MQHDLGTFALLALLCAPAATAQTSLPSGSSATGASPQRTFTEMLAASNTSYRAAGDIGMSPTRQDEIATTLLSMTGSELRPAEMTVDGQLFFHDPGDPSAMLHLDTATSTVVFDTGLGPLGGAQETPNLPSETSAPELALDMIAQIDFGPVHADELVLAHVGGLSLGVQAADGTSQTFEKLRSVFFGRRVDGKKVMGPGSRMVVQLGEGGELHGVIRRWHEFDGTPIPAAAKHTPAELGQMLRSRLHDTSSRARDVRFESAELVLYDDGEGVMEPAIRFVYQLTIDSEYLDETGTMVAKTLVNPLDFYLPILRQPTARYPFVKDLESQTQATPLDANEPPPSSGGGTDE